MNSKNFSPPSKDPFAGRIDELEKYYSPIETIDRWNGWIFWVSAVLSILVFFKTRIPWSYLQDLPEVIFIVAVITHLSLSLYVRFYLFPIAEHKRRKQLLSDSFAVPLITETTQRYYNNEISPSVARLGASVLENTLFAKNITNRMVVRERIKILFYFVVWVLALTWRTTDLGLLVIITQTLFSSEIVENWIRIELLRHETETIYDNLYDKFLHKIDLSTPDGTASVLDTFATYEAVKSMTGVRQLRSIFIAVNSRLSSEWDSIRAKLEIDKSNYEER